MQKMLQAQQGQQGVWFAGEQTVDVDCHESAILAALQVGVT
jgi:hypothetical protein